MSDSESGSAVSDIDDAEIVDMTDEEIPEPKPDVESADDLEGDDEAPMDIGEAMAAEATTSTDEPDDDQDDGLEHDYDDLVEEGAYQIHEGICMIDDLALPDGVLDAGHTVDGYRDDVREYLDDHGDALDTTGDPVGDRDDQDEENDDAEIATVDQSIDWEALWDEFGFDTEGADSIFVSKTQIIGAIEASEQRITGNPTEHFESALSDGVIFEQHDQNYGLRVMFS